MFYTADFQLLFGLFGQQKKYLYKNLLILSIKIYIYIFFRIEQQRNALSPNFLQYFCLKTQQQYTLDLHSPIQLIHKMVIICQKII